jgi:acetylornithine deacetylase/succinyl-diaminopimelate desuccinylase-like protein
MDVQPAGEPTWTQDPFQMSARGGVYGGRGTTDDKGPAITALYGARYAIETGIKVNIRLLWELEEEIGSPNFEAFLAKEAPGIPTDSVVVSDTIWVARGRPAVSTGLRGLIPVTLRLETGTKDCHSGLTGGLARNPIAELSEVISRCVDAQTGRILIRDFYKDVVKPSKEEVQSFVASGLSLKKFKEAHGLRSLRVKDPRKASQAIWALPTFEVHGISGGYQGPGIKTVVPPWAEAKVSMRLVPDLTPAKALRLLKAHIRKINKDVVVTGQSGLEAYKGPSTGPLAEAAAEALTFAFGRKPAFVREGGSIGAVVTMKKLLKCPIMFIGLSLPEHGYHAPNENFDWGQASGGVMAFARYFELLAAS